MKNHELDRLIGLHVMGWTFVPGPEGRWYDAGVLLVATEDWSPTTDIHDAWQVLEHIRQLPCNVYLVTVDGKWCCDLETSVGMISEMADTAPLAICMAALEAQKAAAD